MMSDLIGATVRIQSEQSPINGIEVANKEAQIVSMYLVDTGIADPEPNYTLAVPSSDEGEAILVEATADDFVVLLEGGKDERWDSELVAKPIPKGPMD